MRFIILIALSSVLFAGCKNAAITFSNLKSTSSRSGSSNSSSSQVSDYYQFPSAGQFARYSNGVCISASDANNYQKLFCTSGDNIYQVSNENPAGSDVPFDFVSDSLGNAYATLYDATSSKLYKYDGSSLTKLISRNVDAISDLYQAATLWPMGNNLFFFESDNSPYIMPVGSPASFAAMAPVANFTPYYDPEHKFEVFSDGVDDWIVYMGYETGPTNYRLYKHRVGGASATMLVDSGYGSGNEYQVEYKAGVSFIFYTAYNQFPCTSQRGLFAYSQSLNMQYSVSCSSNASYPKIKAVDGNVVYYTKPDINGNEKLYSAYYSAGFSSSQLTDINNLASDVIGEVVVDYPGVYFRSNAKMYKCDYTTCISNPSGGPIQMGGVTYNYPFEVTKVGSALFFQCDDAFSYVRLCVADLTVPNVATSSISILDTSTNYNMLSAFDNPYEFNTDGTSLYFIMNGDKRDMSGSEYFLYRYNMATGLHRFD